MCILVKKVKHIEKGQYVYVVRYIRSKVILSHYNVDTEWKLKRLKSLDGRIKKRWGKTMLTEGVFHCLYTETDAHRYITAMRENGRSGTYGIYKAWIPMWTDVAYGIVPDGFVGRGMMTIGTKRLKLTKLIKTVTLEGRPYNPWEGTSTHTGYSILSPTWTQTGYMYNTGSTA